MLEAAIQNGADAVYYGVPHWNARGRTEDFSFEDVAEMIRYARIRSVRTFLAMNILVFEREIRDLPEFLEKLIALKPDAFIIQDIGLARLIKTIAPDQEIHASTQMTLASAEAVNFASQLGFNRAVLARELSLKQIASIKEATPLELEVFVHGALCVSYSGQCLTSENFGGRSANRGQCAQSCRLPYRIFVDGKEYRDTNAQYLFSPHDLCALPRLNDLEEIGIDSLKVEGRLKSPEYVAAVAKAYNKALDTHDKLPATDMEPLEVLFSRGLSTGWLDGVDHQALVDGTFSNHHGEYLGEVSRIERDSITVSIPDGGVTALPRQGDGILFENPKTGFSEGGRLYGVTAQKGLIRLQFGRNFELRKVAPGMKVYRNDSPALEKELQHTFADREKSRRIPVDIVLSGKIGEPLRLTMFDDADHKISVESDNAVEASRDTAESANGKKRDFRELAEKELSALGSTAYAPHSLDIRVPANAFVPGKVLRGLRQKATAAMDDTRTSMAASAPDAARGRTLLAHASTHKQAQNAHTPATISVLVRRPNQIEALRGLDIDSAIMDFDWGVKYDEPLEQIRELGLKAGMATLRIHKPGENHYLKNILRLAPDLALVRSLGALAILRGSGIPLHGDYSLNAANSLSYEWLLDQGLQTLHPSWDLNSTQLFDLLGNIDAGRLELALHQYMPAFHSEYCAFARALTDGRRFPECGKICTQHKVEILDHKGEKHFLQSDAECRNTLFVGKPQSALKLFPRLSAAGVNHFRIELLDESPEIARRKIQTYVATIRGNISIDAAIAQAGVEEKYGLSEGQLFNESVWVDRKKATDPKNKPV